jgi:hypothetical protein
MGLARALGAVAVVMLSLAPASAQDVYRINTATYLREVLAELEKTTPDLHRTFDGLQAAVEDLRLAVADRELDAGRGSEWMDRVTAVAGQVASDQLDRLWTQRRVPKAERSKEEQRARMHLEAGDASRAVAEYRDAIEHYRRVLPRSTSKEGAGR